MDIIEMKNITKDFELAEGKKLRILRGLSLSVRSGEFLAIVGPSGSGKSTLMNLMGALDVPTSGSYALDGVDITNLSDNALSDIRNQKIGFVFQNFNLIPRSTALRNVELPMLYGGMTASERQERARELLQIVGMAGRSGHRPTQLSGGERQRVAIARAMANKPEIILADEPTGALDTATGNVVMDIFHKLHREQKKTIVLVTHNMTLADETQRVITLQDGKITNERRRG